jgi:hypothetical protein
MQRLQGQLSCEAQGGFERVEILMNRRAHNTITKTILPGVPLKLINAVNYELDKPSSWAGPTHRKYLHDPISAGIVGAMVARRMGFPIWMGVAAANAHLLEDHASDQMRKVKLAPGLTGKHVFDAFTR